MPRILIMGLCSVLARVVMAAPAPAPDPWAKVPPLPTGCYADQDKVRDAFDAAIDAMNQEVYRQQEINASLTSKLNEIDPMEQQSRMQAFLMENPQEAMKYLETTQTRSIALQEQLAQDSATEQQLEDELTQIQSAYEAALGRTVGPLRTRLFGLGESGLTPAQVAEQNSLPAKINAAYEKECPAWWGAAGPFHGWLKRYKTHLVQVHIPPLDELEEARRTNFKLMGVSVESLRSTATMESVVNYMKHAMTIFGGRWERPFAP